MGQYYTVVNIDKKQCLHPHHFDNGAKLMEWGYIGNMLVNAMMNLLATDWQGDRVYVVGDYADLEDMDEVWAKEYEEAADYLDIPKEEQDSDNACTIHTYAYDHFDDYSNRADIKDRHWRYVVNTATNQYIDLEHCPIEWVWYSEDEDKAGTTSISPIVLLLAMGNGRGGGDYAPMNELVEGDTKILVGSWCKYSRNIEVLGEEETPDPSMEEFCPDFTEREKTIPYTAAEEEMNKCKEERKKAAETRSTMRR